MEEERQEGRGGRKKRRKVERKVERKRGSRRGRKEGGKGEGRKEERERGKGGRGEEDKFQAISQACEDHAPREPCRWGCGERGPLLFSSVLAPVREILLGSE